MYIGQVSRLTGASPKAIRLYESMGLIPVPERIGKYRNYGCKEVELIKIIRAAQRLGFRLSEMREFLGHEVSCDAFPWDKAIVLVQKKQHYLRGEIEKLKELSSQLTASMALLKKKKCDLK